MRLILKWFIPRIGIVAIVIINLLFCIDSCSSNEPLVTKEPERLKTDPNIPIYYLKSIDYVTKEVEYHEFNEAPPEQIYVSPSGIEDIILNSNLEVEDLIDYQLD